MQLHGNARPHRPGGRDDMSSDSRQMPHDQKPGDEVAPGTQQSADNLCPRCGGSGSLAEAPCPDCQGTGQVTTLVGDA
jgi:hypothetical protein